MFFKLTNDKQFIIKIIKENFKLQNLNAILKILYLK